MVKAQTDAEFERECDMLFEPKHGTLDPLELSTQEALVSVHADGSVFIPIQNFQCIPVKLEEGLELGVEPGSSRVSRYRSEGWYLCSSESHRDHS